MYFVTKLATSTWLCFICFCDLSAGDDSLVQDSVDAFLSRERISSVSALPRKKKSLLEYQAKFVALFDGYCNCPILGEEDTESSLKNFMTEFLLDYNHDELDNIVGDIHNHSIKHAESLGKFTQWINKFSRK